MKDIHAERFNTGAGAFMIIFVYLGVGALINGILDYPGYFYVLKWQTVTFVVLPIILYILGIIFTDLAPIVVERVGEWL